MSVQYSSTISRPPVLVDNIPEYKTLATIMKTCFKTSMPAIPEIVGDYLNIKKVAETFSDYLDAINQDNVQMSTNGIVVIDKSVRYLLSKAIETVRLSSNYQATIEKARYSPSVQNKINTDDIEELRIRLAESLTFIEDLQDQNKENQKDQANLASEVEKIYHDGSKLKERFLNNKRAYEDQLSNAQAQYQTLEDKYRDATEKLLLNQSQLHSQNVQLATYAGDLDQLTEENEKLKKKLTVSKNLISKSRQALEQSKHQIAEDKINMKRLLNELEAAKSINVQPTPTTLEKMSSENANLKKQIQELNDKNEKLENQIMDITRENEFGSTIYEVKLDETSPKRNRKYDGVLDENELLRQELQEWKDKYQDSQDIIKQQEDKNKEADENLKQSLEAIERYQKVFDDNHITPDDLPQILDLAGEHESLIQAVQRLRSSLDALCRFTTKLIEDDTADPKLITDRNSPILTDENLRNEVVTRIDELQNYCRQLSQDDYDTVVLYDAIFGFTQNVQALIDNTVLKRENNIYSGLIILVSILSKSQKYLSQINSDLTSVFKLLPFKKDPYTILDVTEYIMRLQPSLKRVKNVLKKEFREIDASADIAEQLSKFMDYVEDLINQMNTDVRSTINSKKSISQLPGAVIDEIDKLRAQNDEILALNDTEIKDMTSKYNARVAELEKELEVIKNRESVTVRFQDILQRKDDEIKKQKEEISELQTKLFELENENDALKTKSDEMEQNATIYKNQRDRLQNINDQRSKSYDKTIKELTDDINRKIDFEVNSKKKRYEIEIEELKKKLKERNDELTAAQKTIKDSSESFEALVHHQRSEMSALVEQNSRLSKKLAKYKTLVKNHQANEESKQLQANVDAILNDNQQNNQQNNQQSNQQENQPENQENSKINDNIAENSSIVNQASNIGPITKKSVKTPPPNAGNLSLLSSRSFNANNNNNNVSLNAKQMQQMHLMQEQMKAQMKEIQQSASTRASDAVKDLLNDIAQILTPYSGVKPNWTRSRVMSTIRELVSKTTGQTSPSEDEWKKWAAGILVSPNSNMSPDEMRTMIKEMVSSKDNNPSRLKLMEKLKSLREQKKFLLLRANLPKKTDPLVVNMKILLGVVNMARRLNKKKEQVRSLNFSFNQNLNQSVSFNQSQTQPRTPDTRNVNSLAISAIDSPSSLRAKTPVK